MNQTPKQITGRGDGPLSDTLGGVAERGGGFQLAAWKIWAGCWLLVDKMPCWNWGGLGFKPRTKKSKLLSFANLSGDNFLWQVGRYAVPGDDRHMEVRRILP